MTISFTNPGEIDVTSLEVMGLSVKENDSPIGRFGTGLKYAVAITLRLGGKIAIWSGEKCYLFETEKLDFRGKQVSRVTMSKDGEPFKPLPFTLDYGQDWKPWQAFRELESNARDELGSSAFGKLEPKAGHTTIWVTCPEIEEAYTQKAKYFLSSTPFHKNEEELVEVHTWSNDADRTAIFYRGVLVGNTEKAQRYCYNYLRGIALSEDRTIQHWNLSTLPRRLAWTTLQSTSREYIEDIITCAGFFEDEPDLPSPDEYLSCKTFHSVVQSFIDEGRANLVNIRYLHWHYKATKKEGLLYNTYNLNSREAAMFKIVTNILEQHFGTVLPTINPVKDLPNEVLGMVAGDTIYIAKKAFDMGQGILLGTIFEELCHWKLNHSDMTRSFQNFLIDTIANLLLDKHYLE